MTKQQYLLACECGANHTVERSQAGQTIECECGKAVEVPSIRGLAALPVAAPSEAAVAAAAAAPPTTWSPLRGLMFTGGLIVGVISAGVLIWSLMGISALGEYTIDRTPEVLDMVKQDVDQFDLEQTYAEWLDLRDQGLGETFTPGWTAAQDFVGTLKTRATIAGILLVVAIAAFVGSLAMPARPASASSAARRELPRQH